MKSLAIITALFATSAYCQPKLDEALLRTAFASFKDPSSVQFRDLKYKEKTPGGWAMCGEFNAKNSYGGYVGFQRFSGVAAIHPKTKKAEYAVFGIGETADTVCSADGLL
jgi:hypothetical protein